MKKTYNKPEVKTYKIQLEQMIAQSRPVSDKDADQGLGMLSKDREDSFDEGGMGSLW